MGLARWCILVGVGSRGPKIQRRFPLEPLLALRPEVTVTGLSTLLGVHSRQGVRWRADGGMTARFADRAACVLGLHPANVWPEEWAAELGVVGACPECGRTEPHEHPLLDFMWPDRDGVPV